MFFVIAVYVYKYTKTEIKTGKSKLRNFEISIIFLYVVTKRKKKEEEERNEDKNCNIIPAFVFVNFYAKRKSRPNCRPRYSITRNYELMKSLNGNYLADKNFVSSFPRFFSLWYSYQRAILLWLHYETRFLTST